MFLNKKLIFNYIFDIPNENYENSMDDFWAESIRLATPATEPFWDRSNLDWRGRTMVDNFVIISYYHLL